MFPAGNGGRMLDTCAYDGYVNSIYTIAVTSITNKGYPSTMNERCSAIMATAYTRDGAKTGSQLDDPMVGSIFFCKENYLLT